MDALCLPLDLRLKTEVCAIGIYQTATVESRFGIESQQTTRRSSKHPTTYLPPNQRERQSSSKSTVYHRFAFDARAVTYTHLDRGDTGSIPAEQLGEAIEAEGVISRHEIIFRHLFTNATSAKRNPLSTYLCTRTHDNR